jgi:hypothetical protein
METGTAQDFHFFFYFELQMPKVNKIVKSNKNE